MDGDGVESLRFLRHSGFRAIQPDGGCWVRRSLGIGNLAGQHNAALNGLRKHCLALLGVLIPAERLAGKERVAKPFEGYESVSATFGLGQGGA